jgi:hypothetical protein
MTTGKAKAKDQHLVVRTVYIPPFAMRLRRMGHPFGFGLVEETTASAWWRLGEDLGGEADFSAALLTNYASSFGRNDGF